MMGTREYRHIVRKKISRKRMIYNLAPIYIISKYANSYMKNRAVYGLGFWLNTTNGYTFEYKYAEGRFTSVTGREHKKANIVQHNPPL